MNGPPKLSEDVQVAQDTAIKMDAAGPAVSFSDDHLFLLEETLEVSKRQVAAGTLRVSTRTETHDEIADVTLDHERVDVTRVPIGHLVDTAPSVRLDGDTTIIPVIEERFVVVKQLYLKEELHIRRHVERELAQVPVQLRRQTAIVERRDASGEPVTDTIATPQS